MKPRKLTIENIRSYRSHEPIEFSDAALIALLGNTGAGKSTLLDAIVLALYGKTIDPQLTLSDLIAPNEKFMSVTLLFIIDNEEYEVHRLFRRKNAPSIHRFSKADGTVVTGSSEVNAAIESLLGLSRETFLSTVLLPQGRFADLLTATPARKQEVFRDLFGLDQIDDIGKAAGAEFNAVELLRATKAGARGAIPASPSVDKGTYEGQLAEARAELARLDAIATQVAAHTVAITGLEEQRRKDDDVHIRLTELKGVPDAVRDVRAAAAKLAPKYTSAEKAVEAGTASVMSAKSVVAELTANQHDSNSLRLVKSSLEAIVHDIREGREDGQKLAAAATALQEADKQLSRCRTAVEKCAAAHEPLKVTETTLKGEAEALATAIATFTEAMRRRLEAFKTWTAENVKLKALAARAETIEGAFGSAHTAREAAKATADADAQALSRAEQLNMAATVASHVHVGEACPVCAQTIPDTFVARTESKLDDAKKRAAASKKLFEAADVALRTQERDKEIAASNLTDQNARVAAAQAVLTPCDATLRTLAGEEDPDAYTSRLTAEHRDALKKCEQARNRLEASTAALDAARVEMAGIVATQSAAADTHKRAEAGTKARASTITARIAKMPESFAPAPDGANVEFVGATLDEAIQAATTAEQQLRALESKLGTDQRTLSQLQLTSADTVSRPLAAVVLSLNRVALLLVRKPLPADVKPESKLIDATISAVQIACDATAAKLSAVDTKIQMNASARGDLLAAVPGGDAPAAVMQAKLSVQRLDLLLSDVLKNIEQAVKLDKKLDDIAPVRSALEALKRLMGADYFKNYLAAQRAARIVAIGSRFLYDMTKRYQFTKDFDIHDLHNNTIRPSASLSGGEKFLASLALSLAVVEQAAVGGAKIESLFLDEGFATLDAECLEVAMQELRSQAKQGHAIWIITHLRDAATYAHASYMIERTPDGSQVRLLDALPEDTPDLEGLLAVLS